MLHGKLIKFIRDTGPENYEEVTFLRVPARLMKKQSPKALAKALDLIPEHGCHCSHCLNDWDCCGNYFPEYTTAKRVRRGLQITTSYGLNI